MVHFINIGYFEFNANRFAMFGFTDTFTCFSFMDVPE